MNQRRLLNWLTVTGLAVVWATPTMAGDDTNPTAKLGHQAPAFMLKDTNGNEHALENYTKEGKIVILEWFNKDCPVCRRHINSKTMINLVKHYKDKDVVLLGVDSTHFHKGLEDKMNPDFKAWGINYPILMDPDGKVGRSYNAKTTPHMFVIDKNGVLAYDGAVDDDRSGSKSESDRTHYIMEAVDKLLAGETVATSKTKPYGCSIKYKR